MAQLDNSFVTTAPDVLSFKRLNVLALPATATLQTIEKVAVCGQIAYKLSFPEAVQ